MQHMRMGYTALKMRHLKHSVFKTFEHPNSFNFTAMFAEMNLFANDSLLLDSTTSKFDTIWGQFTTVPLFLILIVFPLINLKSATFFTRFNALG